MTGAVIAGILFLIVVSAPALSHVARESLPLLVAAVGPALALSASRLGYVSTSSSRLLAGLCALVALGLAVLKLRSQRVPPANRPIVAALLVAGLLEASGAFWAGDLAFSSGGIAIVVTAMAGPAVAAQVLTSSGDRQRFLQGLILSALCVCAISLVLALLAPGQAYSGPVRGGLRLGDERLRGATTHANALGAVTLFAVAATLALRGRSRVRWLLWLSAAACLLATNQRAAVLAGFAALLFFTIFNGLKRPALTVPLALLTTGALLVAGRLPDLGSSGTLSSRGFVRDIISQQFSAWLTGWGPLGLYERSLATGAPELYSHAHNGWLNALVVGGVPLFLLTVALTVLAVIRADAGTAPLLLAFLLINLTESPLNTNGNPELLISVAPSWFVLALLVSSPRLARQPLPEAPRAVIAVDDSRP